MLDSVFANAVILAAENPPEYNQDGSPLGSPGFLGFVITMVLAIGIILLMLDMTRRARRLRYRNEYAMQREAEERAQRSAEGEESKTGAVSTNPDQLKNLAVTDERHQKFH